MGNELADTLAKNAAKNEPLTEEYNRIPKSVVTRELEEESVRKWQRNWTQTTKGSTTKEYFPNVEERPKKSMYVCMYVCMYVYTYVCIYVYMYVCMYIFTYICTICVCMYVCIIWN